MNPLVYAVSINDAGRVKEINLNDSEVILMDNPRQRDLLRRQDFVDREIDPLTSRPFERRNRKSLDGITDRPELLQGMRELHRNHIHVLRKCKRRSGDPAGRTKKQLADDLRARTERLRGPIPNPVEVFRRHFAGTPRGRELKQTKKTFHDHVRASASTQRLTARLTGRDGLQRSKRSYALRQRR